MRNREHGTLLLDVLIGMGMLTVLAVLAGRLVCSGLDVIRSQAHSAAAAVDVQQVLSCLTEDVPAARSARCSGTVLTLTTAEGRKVTYREAVDGLRRERAGLRSEEWPRVRAEFGVRDSGLVEIRLTTSGLGHRPGIVCESAIWARALGTQ
jgi:hypothetical protein